MFTSHRRRIWRLMVDECDLLGYFLHIAWASHPKPKSANTVRSLAWILSLLFMPTILDRLGLHVILDPYERVYQGGDWMMPPWSCVTTHSDGSAQLDIPSSLAPMCVRDLPPALVLFPESIVDSADRRTSGGKSLRDSWNNTNKRDGTSKSLLMTYNARPYSMFDCDG
jgi:hypothetical protein